MIRERESRSEPKYVQLLRRISELKSQGKGLLWERMSLLIQVAEDCAWQEKIRYELGLDILDPTTVDQVLAEYVDDTPYSYYQLRDIFRHFPDQSQWVNGNFHQMAKEVFGKREESVGPKRTRHCVTKADLAEKEDEARRWQFKAVSAQKQIAELKTKLAQHTLAATTPRVAPQITQEVTVAVCEETSPYGVLCGRLVTQAVSEAVNELTLVLSDGCEVTLETFCADPQINLWGIRIRENR